MLLLRIDYGVRNKIKLFFLLCHLTWIFLFIDGYVISSGRIIFPFYRKTIIYGGLYALILYFTGMNQEERGILRRLVCRITGGRFCKT